MTIEAQQTLPAGWYSDPAQSGGDRWWDGTAWTDYIRVETPTSPPPNRAWDASPLSAAPAVQATAAPAAAAASAPLMPLAPGVHSPMTGPMPTSVARTTTSPSSSAPFGMTGGFTGQVGATIDPWDSAARMRPDAAPSNGAALLAFLFGAVAIALAIAKMVPLDGIWVALAGVLAVIFGARALIRRRNGSATVRWAPIVGILFGLAATASVFLAGPVSSLVGSIFPSPASAISATTTNATAAETSPVPLVFPLNASLSSQEVGAQTLATAINRMYASGKATLTPGAAWPASVTMKGTVVESSTGARIATLPVGETATYALSADKSSYKLTVASQNPSELATYTSGLNAFSFSCTAADTNCTPSN